MCEYIEMVLTIQLVFVVEISAAKLFNLYRLSYFFLASSRNGW